MLIRTTRLSSARLPRLLARLRAGLGLGLGALGALAVPTLLAGCGDVESSHAQSLVQGCGVITDTLLQEDWTHGLNGWQVSSSSPGTGHRWTVQAGGQLRSDPGGPTPPGGQQNRIDSPSFDPMGRPHLRVKLQTSFDVAAHGVYQVYAATRNGAPRSLIAEFGGRNPSWPAFDEFTLAVPESFSAEGAVYISIVINSANGGDFGALVGNVSVLGDAGGAGTVLLDDFSAGLGGWSVYSDPGRAGHVWEAVPAPSCGYVAQSDPAGSTVASNYTRLESAPFSLVGKSAAEIIVHERHDLPPGGRYQVFVADMDSDVRRSLIGEFGGRNVGYPAASTQTLRIPADFLGRPRIRVAFLELTGAAEGGAGMILESVQVLAQ